MVGCPNGFVSPYLGLAVAALLLPTGQCLLNLEMNQPQRQKAEWPTMLLVNVVSSKEQDLLGQVGLHYSPLLAIHCLHGLGKVT